MTTTTNAVRPAPLSHPPCACSSSSSDEDDDEEEITLSSLAHANRTAVAVGRDRRRRPLDAAAPSSSSRSIATVERMIKTTKEKEEEEGGNIRRKGTLTVGGGGGGGIRAGGGGIRVGGGGGKENNLATKRPRHRSAERPNAATTISNKASNDTNTTATTATIRTSHTQAEATTRTTAATATSSSSSSNDNRNKRHKMSQHQPQQHHQTNLASFFAPRQQRSSSAHGPVAGAGADTGASKSKPNKRRNLADDDAIASSESKKNSEAAPLVRAPPGDEDDGDDSDGGIGDFGVGGGNGRKKKRRGRGSNVTVALPRASPVDADAAVALSDDAVPADHRSRRRTCSRRPTNDANNNNNKDVNVGLKYLEHLFEADRRVAAASTKEEKDQQQASSSSAASSSDVKEDDTIAKDEAHATEKGDNNNDSASAAAAAKPMPQRPRPYPPRSPHGHNVLIQLMHRSSSAAPLNRRRCDAPTVRPTSTMRRFVLLDYVPPPSTPTSAEEEKAQGEGESTAKTTDLDRRDASEPPSRSSGLDDDEDNAEEEGGDRSNNSRRNERNRKPARKQRRRRRRWGECRTVQLLSSPAAFSSSASSTACLEFDPHGILLASSDDQGVIRLYDFDEVRAADVKGRNRIMARLARSRAETEKTMLAGEPQMGAEEEEERDGGEERRRRRRNSGDARGASISASAAHRRGSRSVAAAVPPILSFRAGAAAAAAMASSSWDRRPRQQQRQQQHRVGCLKWNPWNEDQLAVSFLSLTEVHIYDVGAAPPAPLSSTGPSSLSAPPPFVRLTHPRLSSSREGTSSLLFVPGPPSNKAGATRATAPRLLTGGARGIVRAWTVPRTIDPNDEPSRRQQQPKMVWSVAPFPSASSHGNDDEGASDMVRLVRHDATTLVLVGGTRGSLALLDVHRYTRRAFSTTVTPTVCATWDLRRLAARSAAAEVDLSGKSSALLPRREWMGVKALRVWDGVDPSSSVEGASSDVAGEDRQRSDLRLDAPTKSRREGGLLCLRVDAITRGGWVFRVFLHGVVGGGTTAPPPPPRAWADLVHRTCPVAYLDSNHKRLEHMVGSESSLGFSVPVVPTPACPMGGTSSILCVGGVRPMYQVIPDKDHRVLVRSVADGPVMNLGGQRGVDDEDSTGDHVLLLDTARSLKQSQLSPEGTQGRLLSRIPMPHGPPLTLVIHPSDEWMVVSHGNSGTGRGLSLFCLGDEGDEEQ